MKNKKLVHAKFAKVLFPSIYKVWLKEEKRKEKILKRMLSRIYEKEELLRED